MISYEEALAIIRGQGVQKRLPVKRVELSAITGRVCAQTVKAPMANQPFDNSAMDGFALKAGDLAGAANDNPVMLDMLGHIAAGDSAPHRAPARGQCYEIMTGAPLPPGCDAVVPVEKTEAQAGRVVFRAAVTMGENIRRAGQDFSIGDTVLEQGMVLGPGHILALATLGIGEVGVFRQAKVGLFSTGLEVVDDLDAELEDGQIYNSTGPYLKTALPAMGMECIPCGTIPDDPAVFRRDLQKAMGEGYDIILSTGAVSAGVHDFVPGVLKDMGAEIFFHKVSIRPGKPLLFAKIPGDGPFFFGLPGNPVATAAGLRFFVHPLLQALQGLPPEKPLRAVLTTPYKKGKNDLRFFLRAAMRISDKSLCEAAIPEKQQSFMVSSSVLANAWAVVPESISELHTGELVDIYPVLQ